jgi:hypothetical protein
MAIAMGALDDAKERLEECMGAGSLDTAEGRAALDDYFLEMAAILRELRERIEERL